MLKKLKLENLSETKATIKIYILEFLIDSEDKKSIIKDLNDIWFIKDKIEKVEIYFKYIEIMVNLLKEDDLSKVNIYKLIEIFILDIEFGNKIFYLLSILNKFYLPDLVILLFIGFVLGEKKNFIKINYEINLQDLLLMLNSKCSSIDPKMNIFSLNEKILEVINVYIFFKIHLKKDNNSIDSLENYLFYSIPEELDLNIFYKKLELCGKLKFLYNDKDNKIPSELYENKASILMKNISENIQNIDIYDSLILFGESEDYNDEEEEEEYIENFEDEEEKIIFESFNHIYFLLQTGCWL